MNFIIYFVIINLYALAICFLDKLFAIKGKRRIPEKNLLLVSLLGGCFGFLFGMYMFHHKTKKLKFRLIYLFCIIWIYVLYKFYL